VDCHPVKPPAIVVSEFAARVDYPDPASGIHEIHIAAPIDDDSRTWVSDGNGCGAGNEQQPGEELSDAKEFHLEMPLVGHDAANDTTLLGRTGTRSPGRRRS